MYIEDISVFFGIPLWFLVIVLIWSLTWKLLALWIAARNNSKPWFIALAIINTMGILEILYIFGFSKFYVKSGKKNLSKKKRR